MWPRLRSRATGASIAWSSTREGINRLVASLSDVWQEFDSASLQVDPPEGAAAPVTVEAVTPDQMAGVVARNSTEASIETAQVYAVMNHMASNMPGSDVFPLIHDDPGSLWAMDAIPMPKLTGPEESIKTTHTPARGIGAGQFDNRPPSYQVTGCSARMRFCFEVSSLKCEVSSRHGLQTFLFTLDLKLHT